MPLTHISLWEVRPSVYRSPALSDTCLAGLGGSVLANRLSANSNNRVLLIEAGPRFVDFFIYIFHFCARLPVGGLYTPAIRSIPLFPFRSSARHLRRLMSHGTIPRSLRLVWKGGRSRILADALSVGRLRSVRWSRSDALTTDLITPRLYGLDQRATSID